jgi:hypothetical protein
MKKKLTRTNLREIPLRPYPGMVFVTRDRKAYELAAKELFDRDEKLTVQHGRFVAGGSWYHEHTALVWWTTPETLAHELAHVVLDIFERVGIDPISGGGEPFCYLLSQLFLDTTQK